MHEVSHQQQAFLKRTKVCSPETALSNSLRAALQHNPTYVTSSAQERGAFGNAFKGELTARGLLCCSPVTDGEHLAAIQGIAKALSEQYKRILKDGHLRIGAVQKALNLYLKFLWCLDPTRPTPLHCPIDRTVLRAGGIKGVWTRLDKISVYWKWILELRAYSESNGYANLAEWELDVWELDRLQGVGR